MCARAADVDDANESSRRLLSCGDDLRHDEIGEEEMADMVGGQVHLHSFLSECALRKVHDTSTVDDQVDGGDFRPLKDGGCCCSDRRLGSEVDLKRAVIDVWVLCTKTVDAFPYLHR